jgi:hypothetical protein
LKTLTLDFCKILLIFKNLEEKYPKIWIVYKILDILERFEIFFRVFGELLSSLFEAYKAVGAKAFRK